MNWNDLRILETCARTGSFAKASTELGLNHTSVSRRITALEADLNTKLLHRTPNGIILTKTGESIAVQARDMASAALIIKNTNENSEKLSGRICFETIDARAYSLMPVLKEFSTLYPDIEIDLRLNQGLADLDKGEADVILRATNSPPEDYVGHHITDYSFGVFGAKALIDSYPKGCALHDFPWIVWPFDIMNSWMHSQKLTPKIAMHINTAYGMAQALRAGIGICHTAAISVAHDKDIVCLRKTNESFNLQIWLLAHHSMRNNYRVRVFMKFLRKKLVAERDLLEGRVGPASCPINSPYF
ncbi:MAG: hypothetical protein COA43_15850 [Robiginitomaculum sp.]|nr:MAG: hypothetical protein COA43_15850 [Robiginitomaculum sp.]